MLLAVPTESGEVTKRSTQKIILSHTGIFSPIMSYRNIINPLILQTNIIIRIIQYSLINPQCYKIMLGIALHEKKSCNKRFYKDSDSSPSGYVSEIIKTLTLTNTNKTFPGKIMCNLVG